MRCIKTAAVRSYVMASGREINLDWDYFPKTTDGVYLALILYA